MEIILHLELVFASEIAIAFAIPIGSTSGFASPFAFLYQSSLDVHRMKTYIECAALDQNIWLSHLAQICRSLFCIKSQIRYCHGCSHPMNCFPVVVLNVNVEHFQFFLEIVKNVCSKVSHHFCFTCTKDVKRYISFSLKLFVSGTHLASRTLNFLYNPIFHDQQSEHTCYCLKAMDYPRR